MSWCWSRTGLYARRQFHTLLKEPEYTLIVLSDIAGGAGVALLACANTDLEKVDPGQEGSDCNQLAQYMSRRPTAETND